MVKSYKELWVWQKSIEMAIEIYRLTKSFPKEEVYGIISQMRRSAVSVPSNIAEGRMRGTKKDFVHFLRISMGSIAELTTQLIIADRLCYINDQDFCMITSKLEEISKMISSMIRKLTADS